MFRTASSRRLVIPAMLWLTLASTAPQAQTVITQPSRVTFTNGEPCHYRNAFFDKNVQTDVKNGALSLENNQYGSYRSNVNTAVIGQYWFAAGCENQLTVKQFIYIPGVSTTDHPAIVLPNTPPTIASLKAQLNGVDVVAVTPGTTVDLVSSASDVNGDTLQYTWRAASGTIVSNGTSARWQLPVDRTNIGAQFAYLLVNDGKGGYREAGVVVSTAPTASFATSKVNIVPAPKPAATAVVKPSDHVRSGDHFLTFFSTKIRDAYDKLGADSEMGACRYYASFGAIAGCGPNGEMLGQKENFSQWRVRWQLSPSDAHPRATYANTRDLYLERDMHGTTTAAGTAFYVCNYPFEDDQTTFSNVKQGKNLVACVAMEYSTTIGVNGGLPFTKFLTFGPSGDLIASVNLDKRGEKYLPGACVVCHGAVTGSYAKDGRFSEIPGVSSPAMGAQFLPFDLNNFTFTDGSTLKNPAPGTNPLEAPLRDLNKLVLNTSPTPAIVEVVNGWYPTPTSNFNDAFVPSGWAKDVKSKALYTSVVKDFCRTCHVAIFPSLNSLVDFNNYKKTIASHVCGRGNAEPEPRTRWSMPNSKVTFDDFWENKAARLALQSHLRSVAAIPATYTCGLPNY